MAEASEFFGMDFGVEQPATPEPVQEVVKEVPSGATSFFGKDFGVQGSRPIKEAPVARSNVFETVFNKLVGAESRGQHTDSSGGLTTSPVGARGITQVMPKTGDDPGFGVKPIQNTSEGEYLRFGKDYLRAMLTEFNGDYEKAVAAYNAGHASVKRAITKAEKAGGEWTQYLPKKEETIPYLKKILGVQRDRKAGEGGDPNMVSSDKYIQNLFKKAKENPDFKEMYDFLGDDMPIVKARYLGDSTSGEFATNRDSSGPLHKNGEISIGYGAFNYKDHSTTEAGLNTFVHETAHATDRKIRLLANQLESIKDKTPLQKQFLDTYTKLGKFDWTIGELNKDRMGGASVISNVVKSLAPQWFDKSNDYRASSRELVGWGVGNSSVPKGKGDDKAPAHVDPTVASMFYIMLDQAKRVQKELKK